MQGDITELHIFSNWLDTVIFDTLEQSLSVFRLEQVRYSVFDCWSNSRSPLSAASRYSWSTASETSQTW